MSVCLFVCVVASTSAIRSLKWTTGHFDSEIIHNHSVLPRTKTLKPNNTFSLWLFLLLLNGRLFEIWCFYRIFRIVTKDGWAKGGEGGAGGGRGRGKQWCVRLDCVDTEGLRNVLFLSFNSFVAPFSVFLFLLANFSCNIHFLLLPFRFGFYFPSAPAVALFMQMPVLNIYRTTNRVGDKRLFKFVHEDKNGYT